MAHTPPGRSVPLLAQPWQGCAAPPTYSLYSYSFARDWHSCGVSHRRAPPSERRCTPDKAARSASSIARLRRRPTATARQASTARTLLAPAVLPVGHGERRAVQLTQSIEHEPCEVVLGKPVLEDPSLRHGRRTGRAGVRQHLGTISTLAAIPIPHRLTPTQQFVRQPQQGCGILGSSPDVKGGEKVDHCGGRRSWAARAARPVRKG